jgi:hypothetical protein
MNPKEIIQSKLGAAFSCAALLALAPAANATVHTFTVYMDGMAAVPPNASTAFGHATVTLDDISGVLTITGGYTGITGMMAEANLHLGALRCDITPVLFSLSHTGGTSGSISGGAPLPPGMVTGILEGFAYLEFVSTGFPGGEVRGQLMNGELFCDDCDSALLLCPCSLPGLPDSGCEIAQGTGGVKLRAPTWSPDGFGGGFATLSGTGFPVMSTPTSIVIRGTSKTPMPVPFGDGLRCVGAPVVRLAATFAVGGTSFHPVMHGAGSGFFYYQLWFRNTPAMFCTPDAFNLSNGLELAW